ncbi:MAG: NADH:flavin oxidoreductase [Clostridia bacterium]|nr:NADH:flavin oxidoreductase [Clostridia bacterium]
MSGLFSEITIKNTKLKNRIVFPAMLVCDIDAPNGHVSRAYLDHYEWVSDRGVGMIIAGAAYVSENGKMTPKSQLGVSSDEHIEGLSKIPEICHKKGVPVLMLINHAGVNAAGTDDYVASSVLRVESKIFNTVAISREMTKEEIKKYEQDYVDAAVRCEKAGFDGVQVQCAHTYLFDTFLSSEKNKRTDEYGGSLENRARIVVETIQAIKKRVGPDFIVAVRMPYNAPSIEDAVEFAKMFEAAGADYIEVSWGTLSFVAVTAGEGPKAPEGFKFDNIPYGASQIKKAVSVPVGGVWMMRSESAHEMIENGYSDTVDVLRGILIDPDWVEKAKEKKPSNKCLNCKPICRWYMDRTKCPQWNKLPAEIRLNR